MRITSVKLFYLDARELLIVSKASLNRRWIVDSRGYRREYGRWMK